MSQVSKQPTGLKILFFAELWERFGFYTIQSLLVLYLINVLKLSDGQAYNLFSAFSALVYMTPLIGGYLADKWLGFRKSILLGGVFYVLGFFLLAIPHNPYFYVALSFIIWGNGFFKSCVSSFLGSLYSSEDPRRDGGFAIFYMGINIGAAIAPTLSALIQHYYNWSLAFLSAGCGMFLGITICALTFNSKLFHGKGLMPKHSLLQHKWWHIKLEYLFYPLVFIVVLALSCLLYFPLWVKALLMIIGVAGLLFLAKVSWRYSIQQRRQLWVLLFLIVVSVSFWALYMQTFMSITLFIRRSVNRHFYDWLMPTAMFQTFNPAFIILLSPLVGYLWLYLAKRRLEPSRIVKFALGMICLGLGYWVLNLGIFWGGTATIASVWVVAMFLLQSLGEVSLSPVGLSAVTALAPSDLTGLLMGFWFLGTSLGASLAGYIANLTGVPETVHSPYRVLHIYQQHFFYFGLAAYTTDCVCTFWFGSTHHSSISLAS
jgi:POT family proton-dependent oligopeptide transporter